MKNNLFKISKLKRDIFSGSVMAGVDAFLMIIAYPIYLDNLGAEQYGLWTTLTVLLVFAGMGQLGINQSIIKFVAQEMANDRHKGASQYITAGFLILIIFSCVVFFVLIFFKTFFINILNLSNKYIILASQLIPMLGLLFPVIFFVQYLKGILMGLGKIELSNYVNMIGNSFKVLVAIVFLQLNFGIWSLYLGWFISNVVLFIIYIILSKIFFGQKLCCLNRNVILKMLDLFHYGKFLVGNRMINIAFIPLIKILITRYIGLIEVTYFDIAWKALNKVKIFFDKGFQALIAHIGKIRKKNNIGNNVSNEIKQYYIKSLKLILFFCGPILIILFIFAPQILYLWLSDNFNDLIVIIFRIIMIGVLVDLIILPIWNILLGLNKPNYCFFSDVIKIMVFIIIFFIITKINKINMQFLVGTISLSMILARSYLIVKYKKYLSFILINN